MKNEIRYTNTKELRVQTATDGTRTISGVIPYNSRSCDLGSFVEIIAPGDDCENCSNQDCEDPNCAEDGCPNQDDSEDRSVEDLGRYMRLQLALRSK
jgi:hypothetical protein